MACGGVTRRFHVRWPTKETYGSACRQTVIRGTTGTSVHRQTRRVVGDLAGVCACETPLVTGVRLKGKRRREFMLVIYYACKCEGCRYATKSTVHATACTCSTVRWSLTCNAHTTDTNPTISKAP